MRVRVRAHAPANVKLYYDPYESVAKVNNYVECAVRRAARVRRTPRSAHADPRPRTRTKKPSVRFGGPRAFVARRAARTPTRGRAPAHPDKKARQRTGSRNALWPSLPLPPAVAGVRARASDALYVVSFKSADPGHAPTLMPVFASVERCIYLVSRLVPILYLCPTGN